MSHRANQRVAALGAMALAAVLTGPHATARGQENDEPTVVETIVTDRSVYLDEGFTMNIQVHSDAKPREPDLSQVQHFRISPLVGGAPTHDVERGIYSYQYEVLPRAAGKWELGPIRVNVDGKRYEPKPVTIEALAPERSDDSQLAVSLSNTECYVGEPISLDLVWRVGFPLQAVKAVDISLPVLFAGQFKAYDPEMEDKNDRDQVGLPVAHARVIARYTEETVGEEKIGLLRFSKTLVPQEPGVFTIEPCSVLCSVVPIQGRFRDVWNRYPSFFDNDFFEQEVEGQHQRYYAESEAIQVAVQPLPSEGRPATFAGHVGSFTISVAAEPTHCDIGEPITLTVSILGREHMEAFTIPSLADQPELSRDFRVPRLRSPAKVEGNRVTFVQTIRPLHASVTRIPPIELAYFDPTINRYGTSASGAIPVTVENVRPMDVAGAERSLETDKQRAQKMAADRLAYIYPAAEVRTSPMKRGGNIVLWGLFLLLPPVAYATLSVSMARRRWRIENPEKVRAQAAHRNFRAALRRMQDPGGDHPATAADVDLAVREYLAARTARKGGATTLRDVRPMLVRAGVDQEDLDRLADLFHQFQAHKFGPQGPLDLDLAEAIATAKRTIRAIEEKLK